MLNPLEMERYIAAIAKRANLNVVWEDKCPAPRTDGTNIWLPRMTERISQEDYDMMRHYVVHEVDHVLHTDYDAWKTGEPSTKTLKGAVLNCLEDVRIELKGAREYLGDAINSNNVVAAKLDEIAGIMAKTSKQPGTTEHERMRRAVPLLAFASEVWSDIYPSVAAPAARFRDLCRAYPGAKDKLDKLDKGDYADVLRNSEDTGDIVKLVERLMREVFTDRDPPQQEQEQQGKGKGKGKKEKQSEKAKDRGKGKDDKEEEDDSQDNSDDGSEEQEGDDSEEAEAEAQAGGDETEERDSSAEGDEQGSEDGDQELDSSDFVEVDYSDLMPDPHTTLGKRRNGMHIRYKDSDFADSAYKPALEDDRHIHWHTKGMVGSSIETGMQDAAEYFAAMKSIIAKTNPNFAHQVRIILQVRAKARMEYGQKRGKIHQAALHRLLSDDAHNKDKIFKRKQPTNVLDSCVFLLVDQSGSMTGTKFHHAAVAAAMMSEVIGNVLHIPVMIASFTDSSKQHIHVHREFHQKIVSEDKLLQSFSKSADHGMLGNADGDAIVWAYDQIIRQKQKRKLIIVFSDGSPAGGGRHGNVAAYTKKIVKAIEEETPVNIIGIGIQDHNVERIYKEHHVVNKIAELERALLKCIEGKLK